MGLNHVKAVLFGLLLSLSVYADDTFKTNPNPPAYQAGLGESGLTVEQYAVEADLERMSGEQAITFQWNAAQVGAFKTGYLGPGAYKDLPKASFKAEKLKSIRLSDHMQLTPVLNQGGCGSCVIFGVISGWMDTMVLRGLEFPMLSPQHLMNCGSSGQCSGNYGAQVSSGLVKLGKLNTVADYPYTARTARCQEKAGEKYGQIGSFKTIDTDVQSLLAALNAGHAIAGGVAADGVYSSYAGGVYNPQRFSMGINHYNTLDGIDCEESVDSEGNCVFDENGNLPPGVGLFYGRNSWGSQWGQDGRFVAKITNKAGKRTNAWFYGSGNAQIYDVGIPWDPRPKEPVEFTLSSSDLDVKVLIQPAASTLPEQAKKQFQNTLDSLGAK